MATFEEMQAAWQAQSEKLDHAILLLTEQVRQNRIPRIKRPLRGLIVSLALEAALCVVCMSVLGAFLFKHIAETRFVWPAASMDLWFLATLISSIRQLHMASSVNYDESIASVQGQLARLRILRLKTFRWIFLTGQIVWWIPFLITVLRMFLGIDAYSFLTPTFLWVNLLAGLAFIPLLLFVAKRAPLRNRGSWYERLADVIAGHGLIEAQRQARELANFIQ
jgi:hypothetical protein